MARNSSTSSTRGKLDLATCTGLLVSLCGILGGLLLEGGTLADITQLTAGLIVVGGTLGAVLVTTPAYILMAALRKLPSVFWQPAYTAEHAIQTILELSAKARRTGVISLEREAEQISDPFLRKALCLVVDGTDLKVMRNIMELELTSIQDHGEAVARVFESAGGYAPTVGIIGAVLGLIQVMKHLENISAVGHGIAIAFVATVYGIVLANIFFLPAANKLKSRLQASLQMKEMVIEGVEAIVEGMNPRLLETKLESFRRPLGDGSLERYRSSANPVRSAAPARSSF